MLSHKKMILGHLNFRFSRARNYLAVITLFQTTYLTIREGLSLWWLGLGIVIVMILGWIDARYVYPGEAGLGTSENPEWQKMMKLLEEIKGKL
jgi:hypothetical protein